jgi:AcrR family transcriptional regulator
MKEIQKCTREEKSAETKNKIYKSADELFSKYGFNDVSVKDIVELAGIAKGSFYVHFESKDALIAELINDYVGMIDTDYKTYLESVPANLPTEVILLSFIEEIANIMNDKIGFVKMKAVYKAQITKDIDTDTVMDYNRQIYKMFENILEIGIRRNELKTSIPPDVLARHFMMAFRGITYEWCIRYPEFDLKTQAIQFFKLMISGLK